MKILKLFKIYAQILIVRSCFVLRNIWMHFSLKGPKRYILLYCFIKLDKSAKIRLPIFNGCRNNWGFFTVWHRRSITIPWEQFLGPQLLRSSWSKVLTDNLIYVMQKVIISEVVPIYHINSGARAESKSAYIHTYIAIEQLCLP